MDLKCALDSGLFRSVDCVCQSRPCLLREFGLDIEDAPNFVERLELPRFIPQPLGVVYDSDRIGAPVLDPNVYPLDPARPPDRIEVLPLSDVSLHNDEKHASLAQRSAPGSDRAAFFPMTRPSPKNARMPGRFLGIRVSRKSCSSR